MPPHWPPELLPHNTMCDHPCVCCTGKREITPPLFVPITPPPITIAEDEDVLWEAINDMLGSPEHQQMLHGDGLLLLPPPPVPQQQQPLELLSPLQPPVETTTASIDVVPAAHPCYSSESNAMSLRQRKRIRTTDAYDAFSSDEDSGKEDQDNASDGGSKQFHTCDECQRSYTTREGLRLHVRNIHTNDKKHECTHCSAAFVRKADLNLHLVRMHVPPTERPFPCQAQGCEKAFACRSELSRHMKTHQGAARRLL